MMNDEKVLRRFEKLVVLGLRILGPKLNAGSGIRKVFLMFVFTHVSMYLMVSTFCYVKWDEMDLASFTDPAAYFLIVGRQYFYMISMLIHRDIFPTQVNKILTDRKTSMRVHTQRPKTIKFCKTEIKMSMLYCCNVAFTMLSGMTVLVYLFPNKYQLPSLFYIVFLPFEGISVNWAVSYVFHLVFNSLALIFFMAYVCMSLIFMNHSCWLADVVDSNVQKLHEVLEQTDVDHLKVRKVLRKVLDTSLVMTAWLKQARRITRLGFFAEIALSSALLCMLTSTFIANPAETVFTLNLALMVLTQLFVYCLMGSIMERYIEDLTSALYNLDWHKMKPSQQKDLQIVLLVMQKVKGFDAIFKSVDLRLFQNICEVAYTYMALLRTANTSL